MTEADLPVAIEIAARAFEFDLDAEPTTRTRWRQRLAHPLTTDPGGAFVALADGEPVGVAEAIVREHLWVLSMLTVDPDRQSAGAGRALMQATIAYTGSPDGAGSLAGAPAMPGLIVASNDPRALRLYARAGFELRPTFQATGAPDPARLPAPDLEIVEVHPDQLDTLEQITREVRGAPWTTELLPYMSDGLVTVLRLGDRGFVVTSEQRGIWSLAARDEDAARRLLWQGLAIAADAPDAHVRWLTGDQQWAIDVVLDAGLELSAYGALCVRGTPGTLAPLLPTGPFA